MAVRGAAPVDEATLFGEYPFLPGADRLIEAMSLSIRELLSSPTFDRARSLGRRRALAGADDPRGTTVLSELALAGADERFLSFLFARLVLSSAPNAAPLRRWAVAEAKRAHARISSAPADELAEVARRLGYPMEAVGERSIRLDLVEYVRLAVPIRESDFRLAAQPLAHGAIELPIPRAARLLEEAVRLELARPRPVASEVEQIVRSQEAELLAELARRTPMPRSRGGAGPGTLRPDLFPPCVRKMRRTLESGENLSHAGRFALAAFLHKVGADSETIVDSYRGAPDFDESITRYQVDHITHHDGGQGYEPPECATLRAHGLCLREGDPTAPVPADRQRDPRCFEPSLKHPLQYYRERGGAVIEDPERVSRSTPGDRGARDGRTSAGRESTRSTGPRR